MSFLTGRVTALRFRVDGAAPPLFSDDHLGKLRDHQAGRQRIASADGVESGWSAGDSVLDTEFTLEKNIINDALCFDLRIDTDRLPADLLKAYFEVELKALAKGNPSGLPSMKQKREAKESARNRLEDEAKDGRFRKRKCIPVLWDRTTNEVLFGASSLAQVDRFTGLFEQTFGMELRCQTAGVQALDRADDPVILTPSEFILGITPSDVAWLADSEDWSYLGNEFMLWLWCYSDVVSDTVKLGDGSEVTFMLARSLVVDCPRGQTGIDGFKSEGPARLPEARRAIQAGKLPRKAGLTLVRHAIQYELTLSAETLAITGAKLPPPDDSVETARAKLEHRVESLRGLLETLDGLYGEFLRRRLGAKWSEELAGMQKWLKREERRAA